MASSSAGQQFLCGQKRLMARCGRAVAPYTVAISAAKMTRGFVEDPWTCSIRGLYYTEWHRTMIYRLRESCGMQIISRFLRHFLQGIRFLQVLIKIKLGQS